MDLLSLLRMLGGLAIVLGMLAGALWIVRRYNIKLPGRIAGGAARRIELVERLPLDGRRSVALIRRDGREHLILLAPEGPLVVETAILRDEVDHAAEAVRVAAEQERVAQAEADAAAFRESVSNAIDDVRQKVRTRVARVSAEAPQMRESFSAMVDKVRDRVRPTRAGDEEAKSDA